MTRRPRRGAEMPEAPDRRPLDGQLDEIDELFDFAPVFDRTVRSVTSPASDTRHALHEMVCILSTRLHIERHVLDPLLEAHDPEGYLATPHASHRRIEILLVTIDRRHPSDPDLLMMFEELQEVVRENIAHHREPAARYKATLTVDEREALRFRIMAAVDTAMTRPHPHLPHSGVLGSIARRVTLPFDRLRRLSPVR